MGDVVPTPEQKKQILEEKKRRMDFDRKIAEAADPVIRASRQQCDMNRIIARVRAKLNPHLLASTITHS